uniref:Coiled-coil domain containing 125 n=1 Tax=Leptobrachium leishanense TaxID=445787 RepID=A0A8C5LLD9_9ANUR
MSGSLAADYASDLEDEDFMAGGDLGEGFGRKPGGLYEAATGQVEQTHKLRKGSDTRGHYHSLRKGEEAVTSSSQQVKRRSSDERGILKNGTDGYARCRQNSIDASSDISNEDLRQRLQELTEEVDLLRIELEASQRQLDGKDEALKILQSMEINVLQWEIEFDQVRLKNLEESWKEKYDRLYCENVTLKETLESRTSEVTALKSENTIVSQQCQELLAMLDVKQQKMFQDNMAIDKNSLMETTALELAVLGACTCSAGGKPCSCAKMSAATRKQLLHLRQEFDVEKKSKEEAYVMADAFRIAFEQQLKRQNDEHLPLNDIERICKKGSKRLNGWRRFKEDGYLVTSDTHKGLGQKLKGMLNSSADCKNLESVDDPQEILRILIDMLNDKEEALAHQRKVSYMLARTIEDKVEYNETHERPTSGERIHQSNPSDSRPKTDPSLEKSNSCCISEPEGNGSQEDAVKAVETSFSSVSNKESPEKECQEITVSND